MANTVSVYICRALLALVFGTAAIQKLRAPTKLLRVLKGYGIEAAWAQWIVALVLPCVELGCALALLVGFHLQEASAVAIVLLGVFTGAMVRALLLKQVLPDCGCGIASGPVTLQLVFRNTGLVLLAIAALLPPYGFVLTLAGFGIQLASLVAARANRSTHAAERVTLA